MEVRGSVAMITGGASGLGAACARLLVEHGARVSLLDMDKDRGERLSDELGDAARFYETDVTQEDMVRKAVDATAEAFEALHVTVNCAGVGIPAKVLGKEGPMPMDPFKKVVQINLIGTMNVLRLAAARMAESQGNQDGERGVIINTASVAAFEGQVGQCSYSASKAGIVGVTLPAARELAEYGIRVVTIAPGLFDTPMLASLPEKVRESLGKMPPFPTRLGRPGEYALLVKHIIENSMLNGTTIRLDGALRMAAR